MAAKTHIHDASEIQSGVLDIARIPVAALERLIPVDDLAEMYTLTVNDVQVGDTVQCEDTGIMYRVIDTSNLDNSNGYKEYTAGVAASVPWSGITGKPETFAPSAHTHMYAGSASVGGSAISAAKLDSNDGSATQPVYFAGGKPTACTYQLNKTVPADALFTDTHYEAKLVVNNSNSATSDTSSSLSNGNVFLNLVENGTVKSAHRITGGGDIKVTTDTSGNILITLSDTKYSQGDGIEISGTTISNAGVRSVSTGSTNGTISVNTGGTSAEVPVAGLGSAAFTNSNAYATSGHTHSLSIAKDATATSAVILEASQNYTLTAGGNTYTFTTSPDTKYTEGSGISLSGTTISNAGVRSISTGATNGTISVNTGGTSAEVAVYGLGSAAFTDSTAYSASNHTHNYAGSSTSGGAANSAIRLQTERKLIVSLENISSSSNFTSFDGSKDLDGSDSDHPTIPITGTLSVGHGGTGATTFTAYGLLMGNGTSAVSAVSPGSAGNILMANGTNAAPSWTATSGLTVGKATVLETARKLLVGLNVASTDGADFNGSENLDGKSTRSIIPITGTLGVTHGGTGAETLTAFGVLYGNGTNAVAAVSPGSSGQVLKANGANAAPSWEDQANLVAGSADKLSTSRTITLAVAEGANGGITGTVTTNFNNDVTINTTLSAHTHDAAEDITSGILPVARGGTGYGSIDATPTSGSDRVVKSSGVHKRIAYKKVTLIPSGWSSVTGGYSQSIATGNDITANTEIVSVKLDGAMLDDNTTITYTETFTGDDSTKTFTLAHTPTTVT